MTVIYHAYELDWDGITLSVEWAPSWYGSKHFPISHLQIRSDDGLPLPMTKTGYRSHFVPREDVEARGGSVDYVRAWLDHEADQPGWKQSREERKQLSLF